MLPDNEVAAETNLWHMRWAHSTALILQLTSLYMKKRGEIFMQLLSWFHVPYSSYCFKQVCHCNSQSSIFVQKIQQVQGLLQNLLFVWLFFIWLFLFHSHCALLQPGRKKHTFWDYLLTKWFHWNLFFSVAAFRRHIGHSDNKWAPVLLCG